MKKYLLIILTFSLLISACNQENKLEGLWYAAYKQQKNGKSEALYEKLLLDIKNDSCYTIRIGNLATGDLDEIIIESHFFDKENESLHFDNRNFDVFFQGDSLTLKPKGEIDSLAIYKIIVLRKLKTKYKNLHCSESNFNGSFVISGENYTDSLDFVNDSILIHTGEWNLNFPANKWEIINYQNFSFFYIHDETFPLTLIKFCSKDSILLEYPFKKDYGLVLHPTESLDSSEELIGVWNEIQDSVPRPPLPKKFDEQDLYYNLELNKDSVTIRIRGNEQKLKWHMSSDGKRIFFLNKEIRDTRSWKILDFDGDKLTIRINSETGSTEEIVRLKKRNNR